MPRVFLGHALAFEHMSQVPFTVCTLDLRAKTIGIGNPQDCIRKVIVETGPTTTAVEFCFCREQSIIAATTHVGTGLEQIFVFTSERRLCAFVFNHVSFLCSEGIPSIGHAKIVPQTQQSDKANGKHPNAQPSSAL